MTETVPKSIRISKELSDKMEALAEKNKRDFTFLATRAIEQYVEKCEADAIAAEVEEGKRKAALQAPPEVPIIT